MGVSAVDRAPAEVVGEPGGFGTGYETFEAPEVLAIGGLGGAEVHGDAMLDDFIVLHDAIEHVEGAASVDHVILRNDFKPIDSRLVGEDVVVMGDAQADSDAVILICVETIPGHADPLLKLC